MKNYIYLYVYFMYLIDPNGFYYIKSMCSMNEGTSCLVQATLWKKNLACVSISYWRMNIGNTSKLKIESSSFPLMKLRSTSMSLTDDDAPSSA
jgi:hypothetical protein